MTTKLDGDTVMEYSKTVDGRFFICIGYPYIADSENYIITLAYEGFKPVKPDNYIKGYKEDLVVYCFNDFKQSIIVYLTPFRYAVVSDNTVVKDKIDKVLSGIYKSRPIPLEKAKRLSSLIDATVELIGQIVNPP